MTYQDAVAYLGGFTNFERTHDVAAMRQVPLDRMRRLCRRMGDPQRSFRSVVITGTNGKGSVAMMLYSMLRESDLRIGLYTSPHVDSPRERIRTWDGARGGDDRAPGNDWISESEFASLTEELQPALEAMRNEGPDQTPTYFEIMTALAFLHFRRLGVAVAALEVGLGGRLDATNVVDQAVSVITPIDLDHAEILGSEPVFIAREKAGIIKANQTVITAAQQEAVLEVLRGACAAHEVPLRVCGPDFGAEVQRHDAGGLQLSIKARGFYPSVELPLMGRHQAQNAALAVAALEALSPEGLPRAMVERGLARVECPGRIEVLSDAPLIVLDGGHNPHAAGALAAVLDELWRDRRIHLVVGMSADKSVEGFGEALGRLAISATCTRSRHARAMDPVALAKRLAPYCADVHVMSESADACTYLLNALSPSDVIVVAGSFFLVGELRASLRKSLGGRPQPAAA